MKKVAVTVAVLALGLAACAKNDAADNEMAANDMYTENAAETDANAAMTAAENALENAGEAVENAGEAVENAAEEAAETTTNE